MATTAAPKDASLIVKGIRLGGSTDVVAALDAALADGGPLTPDSIERFAHPDWDRVTFEQQARELVPSGAEVVGLARLYGPDEIDAPGLRPSWALAAAWYGWLPGIFDSRTAALIAYGYVLGREQHGPLEDLRDRIVRGQGRPVEVSDLIDLEEG